MDGNETIQSTAKPEARPQKSMRGALRWLLAVLLVFGLGARQEFESLRARHYTKKGRHSLALFHVEAAHGAVE